jgi:hypothetical protein
MAVGTQMQRAILGTKPLSCHSRVTMTRSIGILLCLVLASGCAGSAHEFQIVATGHGTFIIPSPDLMGTSSSSNDKARAYDAASAYCTKRGGAVETILTSANEAGFTEIAAPELEFRCVAPTAK